MEKRLEAWFYATQFVDAVVEKYPLEEYTSGAIFGTQYPSTKVDQKLRHIMDVANWILGRDI